VWVVGDNSEFLLQAFMHHRDHYKKMKLATGAKAKELMQSITEGKIWSTYNVMQKLEALVRSAELSTELGCVKSNFRPMVSDSIYRLNANPIISSAQNSWSKKSPKKITRTANRPSTSLKSTNLFYRFCIN
jgi:hypothetical protein